VKLREALFYSSKDTAYHESSESDKAYRIYVKEEQEEYKPTFIFPTSPPGPYYRPVYNISVHTIKDNVINEPHGTYHLYGIDRCEGLLRDWSIGVEQGWTPDEHCDNDEATAGNATE